jgi:hypothetical protein
MSQKKRPLFLLVTLIFCMLIVTSCSIIQTQNTYAGSNTGNPMEPTRQINRVYPSQRDDNRYLDSNKRKRKTWTRIRMIFPFDCPWDKTFTSTSHKRIERKLWWRRLKLKREIRRNK